jgi:uncharacterized protein
MARSKPERLIDVNVFIHAYVKPRRQLSSAEAKIKDSARSIVTRINEGEAVAISVVHLSEIFNMIEDSLSLNEALVTERDVCFKQNIEIVNVSYVDYLDALGYVDTNQSARINDALAYAIMKRMEIVELYSFDKDFDRFSDIDRLTS